MSWPFWIMAYLIVGTGTVELLAWFTRKAISLGLGQTPEVRQLHETIGNRTSYLINLLIWPLIVWAILWGVIRGLYKVFKG